MKVYLFCDGASRGNPGLAGIGFIIYDERWRVLKRFSKNIGITTNNVAEYMAILTGLRTAKRIGARRVKVFSDSKLVVNQLKGAYKIKKSHLEQLYTKIKSVEKSFEQVSYNHVSRTNKKIATVDRMINRMLDRLSKTS